MACILARRTRSEWDRPASDTRLLPIPFPRPSTVSPGPSTLPHGRTTKPSAPSRLPPSGVIPEEQACLCLPRTVDARATARKDPTCAQRGVRMDACFDSLQMFPRLTPASVTLRRGCLPRLAAEEDPQLTQLRATPSAVDARALARMYFFRTALPGVATIACTKALAISHAPAPDAPANAAEGALATPSLILSSHFIIPGPSVTPASLTRHSRPLHRHSGRREPESIPGGEWCGAPGIFPSRRHSIKTATSSINLQSKFNQNPTPHI